MIRFHHLIAPIFALIFFASIDLILAEDRVLSVPACFPVDDSFCHAWQRVIGSLN